MNIKIPENVCDLCIAWNWEYDADFVHLISDYCAQSGFSVLQIMPDNIDSMVKALINREIFFSVFLDRASEVDDRFMPFVRWACEHCRYFVNHHERALQSWNKAAMHYNFINAGLNTPYTIVLPSYEEQPVISGIDIHQLGERFIAKPVLGSGGEDVVMNITSLSHVNMLRQKNPVRRYLLQKCIVPRNFKERPAWFRVLFCRDQIYICWWHPETHIYTPVTDEEENEYDLGSLSKIAFTIAALSGLDIFSTEIALTEEALFVVVDYVNDQPDLRIQSSACDGVPDDIVSHIARCLCDVVVKYT